MTYDQKSHRDQTYPLTSWTDDIRAWESWFMHTVFFFDVKLFYINITTSRRANAHQARINLASSLHQVRIKLAPNSHHARIKLAPTRIKPVVASLKWTNLQNKLCERIPPDLGGLFVEWLIVSRRFYNLKMSLFHEKYTWYSSFFKSRTSFPFTENTYLHNIKQQFIAGTLWAIPEIPPPTPVHIACSS